MKGRCSFVVLLAEQSKTKALDKHRITLRYLQQTQAAEQLNLKKQSLSISMPSKFKSN
jgi:hypothetical protein